MTTTPTRERTSAGIAWGAVLWMSAVHLGALLAFVPAFFRWEALLVCLLLHWLTGSIGICLTYHRLLTHRSFATRPKALEYLLTILGTCAMEGGAIGWVADHRRHHAHSDEADDVHSPRRGFGWAHMFWWITPDLDSLHDENYYRHWAPDLFKDPVHVWLDRFHLLFPLLLGVALYLVGGMPWLVWGGFVRTVFLLHTTWFVNSATHLWGYRSHPTKDHSTNLWWVGLLAYGEGWHNNHHAFPTSARHGMRWWEIDMTYMAIRVLRVCGLAHTIRLPRPEQMRPTRVAAPAAGRESVATPV